MIDDLPTALIAKLERFTGEGVGAMRATVYDVLQDLGLDVAGLVAAERSVIHEDAKATAAQREAQRRLLEERVASGRLTASQARKAQAQIAHLDVAEKAARREASRILNRATVAPSRQLVPSAPTPERVRRWGEDVVRVDRDKDGAPLSGPRFELRWAIDRMSVSLSAEEYTAATRLRETYARRLATPKTVDLNGSGGGSPGSRLPVSEAQIAAGREWNAIWHRMPPAIRLIVLNFVCEEAPKGHDAPMTAVEFGRLYGGLRDVEGARGVTRGSVKTACAVIAGLFHDYDAWRSEQARAQRRQIKGA